jgi:hypothetical protein
VLPDGPLTAAQVAGAQVSAPLAALRSIATDPVHVLGDLFSSRNTEVMVVLLGPLLFLPLVATRYVLPAIPAVVLGVAGQQSLARLAAPGVVVSSQAGEQVVVALPFVVLAATMAFGRIGRQSITRINVDHRLVAALAFGLVLFFVQSSPTSPYQKPWAWGGQNRVDEARQRAADKIPAGASVVASAEMTELLAERRVVTQLPPGPPARAATRGFEAVVLDTTAKSDGSLPAWTVDKLDEVMLGLRDQGFKVRYREAGIIALSQ